MVERSYLPLILKSSFDYSLGVGRLEDGMFEGWMQSESTVALFINWSLTNLSFEVSRASDAHLHG